MGESQSKPQRKPSLGFHKPWRTMHWENKNEIEQHLRDFELNQPDVRFVRILICGDVGAGKSSFINSVNNVFQKRITAEALTNALGGKSFTQNYRTHSIKGGDGSPLPFVFNDVMGLETGDDGAQTQDMIRALHGLLQEGFSFKHSSSVSKNDHGYKSKASLGDQTYCLAYIMAADTVSLMRQEVLDKMKKIRDAAGELNIPQVIIMTKPDKACPLVHQDLRRIYFSKKIKEKMQECSNLVGVTMNHVFPVKNYHEEMDTDDEMDSLILKALDQIVNIACDALRNKSETLTKSLDEQPE